MTIEEIHTEWAVDGKLDRTNLVKSALDRFELHNKYWKILNNEKRIFFKIKADRATYYDFLLRYWTDPSSSSIPDEELEMYGFPVRNGLAMPKAAVDKKIEADPKFIELNLKYCTQEQKCEFLIDIIQSIRYRNKDIENALTAIKFENAD